MSDAMSAERKAALLDLLARVEAAEGPDREIDAEIALTFRDLPEWMLRGAVKHIVNTDTGYIERVNDDAGCGGGILASEYTASLDAALALVERVLPEWQVISFTMGWRGPGKLHDHLPEEWRKRYAKANLEVACVAELRHSEHSYVSANAEARTPALALLAALLKALTHD